MGRTLRDDKALSSGEGKEREVQAEDSKDLVLGRGMVSATG